MSVIFYLFLFILVAYFLSLAISFYNQIIFDKYRFRYFALRDRLAFLVAEGELDENSWEYKNLVDVINFHIRTVETMSISNIVEMLVSFYSGDVEVNIISKKIENEKVLEIVSDFISVTLSLLRKNSKAELTLIRLINKFYGDSEAPKVKNLAVPTQNTVSKLNAYKDSISGSLQAA